MVQRASCFAACLVHYKELSDKQVACGNHSEVHAVASSIAVASDKHLPSVELGTFPFCWHSSCSSCVEVQPLDFGGVGQGDFGDIALVVG